jgi:hypothetical protein
VSVLSDPHLVATTELRTAPAAIAASSSPNRPTVFHLTLNRKSVNKTAMVEKATAKVITLLASDVAGASFRLCTHPIV